MTIDIRRPHENDPRSEQVVPSNRHRDLGLVMRERQCRRTGRWFGRLETAEGRAVTEFEAPPSGRRADMHKAMSVRGKEL